MQIDVIASVNEAIADDFYNKTAIVLDVLRATSNIATALAYGCSGVVPAETVQQTKSLQEPGDLLGGERNCCRIAGFDLGNSPFEYLTPDIRGKRIVMTTTNGTRAIQKSLKAQHVLAGSLLNAEACALTALELRKDIVIVCAGTQDAFSLEDGVGAGLVIAELLARSGSGDDAPSVNDTGLAMHHLYLQLKPNLHEALQSGYTGKRLTRLGFADDISYCAQTNLYGICPLLRGKTLVAYEPSLR